MSTLLHLEEKMKSENENKMKTELFSLVSETKESAVNAKKKVLKTLSLRPTQSVRGLRSIKPLIWSKKSVVTESEE